jgi:hypothetical protein
MKFTRFNYFLALLAGVLVIVSSCKKDDDIQPPPEDSAPQISITNPDVPYTLARIGDVVTITWQSHDNEQLSNFKITEKQTDPVGNVYMPETQIITAALATIDHEYTLNYTVPTTPSYYCTIELRGYAIDNKGRTVSVKFVISVIPPPGSPSQFDVQQYNEPEGDTIWMQYTGMDYNFDIYQRRHGDDTEIPVLERHIREISTSLLNPVGAFQSPYWNGADSILVFTTVSDFDYDNMTWETAWQAFMSSNMIGDQAGPALQNGDVAILKLQNAPHFAVFRVLDVRTDASVADSNYVRFNYSYTHP